LAPVGEDAPSFAAERSPVPAAATLVARGLRVARGGKDVLRGVDLEARAGEVLGVLGPSGAGKSTLFRALVGEDPPDQGSVSIAGQDVTRWPLWRRARAGVGYVPQGPSVLWDLTVRQNLDAFRLITRMAPEDAAVAAARVGLEQRLDVRAGELSSGERRRLELARAVTRLPRVLVCDEPFAGVDPVGAERLGDLLQGLARDGAAVILADHHVAEALRVCSHATLLLDGRVAVSAPAADFPSHPLVRGRYLGTWQRDSFPAGYASSVEHGEARPAIDSTKRGP
jgi:lipopolysaccharide export system ATP-binding protein